MDGQAGPKPRNKRLEKEINVGGKRFLSPGVGLFLGLEACPHVHFFYKK